MESPPGSSKAANLGKNFRNAARANKDSDGGNVRKRTAPARNTVEQLSKGIVITQKNMPRQYTILLVGETGTGKTSLLSLFDNILAGRDPKRYVLAHDKSNEAGGSEKQSQTKFAKLYETESTNGVKIRILDTPGLADTRGIEQDAKHKESIAEALRTTVSTVDAVVILANGTVPRLSVATDYALSALSSIFSRSLAKNIAILFTNVQNQLARNFDKNSLPDALKGDNYHPFWINNPIALWKKYNNMRSSRGRDLKEQEDYVCTAHKRAVKELTKFFDWLDNLEPQPTQAIPNINTTLESCVADFLLRTEKSRGKRKELEVGLKAVEDCKSTMERFREHESAIERKFWVLSPTPKQTNLLCTEPDCYSNCYPNCYIDCSSNEYRGARCGKCKHYFRDHFCCSSLWKQDEPTRSLINKEVRRKYEEAHRDKTAQEKINAQLRTDINRLDVNMVSSIGSIAQLIEIHAKPSLSGGFVELVKSIIQTLQWNVDDMRKHQADTAFIEGIDDGLARMKRALRLGKSTSPGAGTRSVMGTKSGAGTKPGTGSAKTWKAPGAVR